MGCTPTTIKNKDKIPPINARPSASKMPNTNHSINNHHPNSKPATYDYDEIRRYDPSIKEEEPTPTGIECIDFINKRYMPST